MSSQKIHSIFETIRVENFTPLNFSAHFQRLSSSAEKLNFPFTEILTKILAKAPSEQSLLTYLQHLLKQNNSDQARLKLILTTTDFQTEISPLFPSDTITSPQKAITVNLQRIHPQFKHSNLKIPQQALSLAHKQQAIDAILLDKNNFALEGSITNLFIIKNNQLTTNQKDCLPGTMQNLVIQTCQANSIPIKISSIHLSELESADEIFLTNAIKRIIPINKLNNSQKTYSSNITQQIINLISSNSQ